MGSNGTCGDLWWLNQQQWGVNTTLNHCKSHYRWTWQAQWHCPISLKLFGNLIQFLVITWQCLVMKSLWLFILHTNHIRPTTSWFTKSFTGLPFIWGKNMQTSNSVTYFFQPVGNQIRILAKKIVNPKDPGGETILRPYATTSNIKP